MFWSVSSSPSPVCVLYWVPLHLVIVDPWYLGCYRSLLPLLSERLSSVPVGEPPAGTMAPPRSTFPHLYSNTPYLNLAFQLSPHPLLCQHLTHSLSYQYPHSALILRGQIYMPVRNGPIIIVSYSYRITPDIGVPILYSSIFQYHL